MLDTDIDEDGHMYLAMTKATFDKILIFFYKYIEDPIEFYGGKIETNNVNDLVPKWYADYVMTLSRHEYMELIRATNLLDYKPLMTLLSLRMATNWYGLRVQVDDLTNE